jgi:hypothetical protein
MTAADDPAIPVAEPPSNLWCHARTLPIGEWVLGGPKPSSFGWHISCPSCLDGRAALDPDPSDPFGYILAAEPCTRGCDPELIQWWHLWRSGELPPTLQVEHDGRAQRYARAVLRRIAADLQKQPTEARLKRAAYDAGRWAAAGGIEPTPVAGALLAAVAGAVSTETSRKLVASNLTAGMARPARVPS